MSVGRAAERHELAHAIDSAQRKLLERQSGWRATQMVELFGLLALEETFLDRATHLLYA